MKILNDDESLQENFSEVVPNKYADKLKLEFQSNPELWYKVIVPKTKADDLRIITENDYSKIWHTHCEFCFKTINKDTKEMCYVSEDGLTWLCKECYNLHFKK